MATAEGQQCSPSLLGHLSSVEIQDAGRPPVTPPADLLLVISSIAGACKTIAHEVRRAGLTNSMGLYQGSQGQGVNAGGEKQKKLDVISVSRPNPSHLPCCHSCADSGLDVVAERGAEGGAVVVQARVGHRVRGRGR